MTDDAVAGWVFAALVVTVLAVLDAVIQSFFLHSALGRGKVHAPELAGIRLLVLWAPAIAVWLAAGIGIGLLHRVPHCTSADYGMLWLALLYPLTTWPAPLLARKAGVRLGCGYVAAHALAPLTLFVMGGLPCVL